jgi:DNA-binding response OmpR family regulator
VPVLDPEGADFLIGSTMPETKARLLIVEDDIDVADMLTAYFRVQGYEVVTVSWGEDAVQTCRKCRPNLIILDIHLPGMDGFEVARTLRGQRGTADIPIIFLSEKRERTERLLGLELGADDYITKPFDVQELRLRVRNTLQHASHDSLTNLVTGLPEGAPVDQHLQECLEGQEWALVIISLENLDSYRESYGFVASDDVLRTVALMIQNLLHELGDSNDFLGHLDPTDFVLVTRLARVADLQASLHTRLEQTLGLFYPSQERANRLGDRRCLGIRLGVLQPGEEGFSSLEVLKLALLRQKP